MADRRVKVVFSAEVENFKRAMEESAKATEKTAKASDEAGKKSEQANKKSQEATKQTADEIAKLAAAHQDAAKAANLQYSSGGQLVDMNGKMLSSQQAAAHGLETFSREAYLAGKAAEEVALAEAEAARAAEELVASTAKADTTLQSLVASATENSEEWEELGGLLLGVGASATVGLGLAAKAAMDWESAWAGVTKTVDGTPEQMDELEASLRGLAKTLPATHEEIAGVAEAAGQLGVKREDVVGFTETMIALGETTNLSADEAATAIAQISNVMGTMERDGSEGVERFSATLVALGNAGASTEAEIVAMAQRIAGAGKLVGASESDVLALANAMASVGIEAQLGGGVMSRVMQRMYADVKTGGEGLDNLAKVAGVSSKDFATAFETDPVRAVDAVVQGLNKVKESGGNVIDTMANLGIKGTEETSVILRLAGAGDLLTESLTLGDAAWKSNSALAEEAAKRYETTEAKVQIAWNNITDAAIDAGAVLLPMIAGVAESVAGMAQAFGSLPDPVKGALSVLGGVVGVAALGAGAFLTLAPRVLDTMAAFNRLAPAGGRARTALAGAGKAAGALTAVLVGFEVVKGIANSMQPGTKSVEEFTQSLIGLRENAGSIDDAFRGIDFGPGIKGLDGAGDALNRLINQDIHSGITSFASTVLGVDNSFTKMVDGVEKVDQAIATAAASGNMELAAMGFKAVAESVDGQKVSLEQVGERFPEYMDSLRKMASDSKVALTEQELLNWAMGETPAAMEAAAAGGDKAAAGIAAAGDASEVAAEQTEEIQKALEDVGVAADGTVTDLVAFTDALVNAGLLQLSARDAARNFEAAIDAVTESIKTNGTTLDTTTEKGRANEAALDAIAGAGFALVGANAAASASEEVLQGNLSATYDELIANAEKFGITGQAAVDLARDVLKVPDGVSIDTWMADTAKRMAQETKAAVDAVPNSKTVGIHVQYTESGTAIRDRAGDAGMSSRVQAYATGGRLPGFADGGQLPTSGPGTGVTDGFLGISSVGIPMARVDAGEWIVNRGSSDRYSRELAAINAGTFPKLPGFATGGMFAAGSFAGSAGGGNVTVSAPAVTVMIGNEQLDARMYSVAGSVVSSADSASQHMRRGRA